MSVWHPVPLSVEKIDIAEILLVHLNAVTVSMATEENTVTSQSMNVISRFVRMRLDAKMDPCLMTTNVSVQPIIQVTSTVAISFYSLLLKMCVAVTFHV